MTVRAGTPTSVEPSTSAGRGRARRALATDAVEQAERRIGRMLRWAAAALLLIAAALLAIDIVYSGVQPPPRLVASGFVASVAANLFSGFLLLAGVELTRSSMQAAARRAEQARWAGARAKNGARMRLFAVGMVNGLVSPLGVNLPLTWSGFAGRMREKAKTPEAIARLQVHSAREKTELMLRTMTDHIECMPRHRWPALIEQIRQIERGTEEMFSRPRHLAPEQEDLLWRVEDAARAILTVWTVTPWVHASEEEMLRSAAEMPNSAGTDIEALRQNRAFWLNSVAKNLSNVMTSLVVLAESTLPPLPAPE